MNEHSRSCPWLGEDDFLMYLGDNFLVGGVVEQAHRFREERPDAQILLAHVPDPEHFGIADLGDDGRVRRLDEKPEFPKSDLALVGVYFFTAAVHRAIGEIRPSGRGELEITDAVQWLIDSGHTVTHAVVTGYWKDTGNADNMLEVNRSVLDGLDPRLDGHVDGDSSLEGRVVVEQGARVLGSTIVGPAIIGADVVVSGSHVGPFTSVAHDSAVHDSEIGYSIVLPGAVIDGVRRIEASIIGRNAEVAKVRSSPGTPSAHRLLLGDHSRIRIHS